MKNKYFLEEIRRIRYDEITTGVDVKEHIAVEVVIKKKQSGCLADNFV